VEHKPTSVILFYIGDKSEGQPPRTYSRGVAGYGKVLTCPMIVSKNGYNTFLKPHHFRRT
jgi:hypothetical protein